jgi:hypothetical protein
VVVAAGVPPNTEAAVVVAAGVPPNTDEVVADTAGFPPNTEAVVVVAAGVPPNIEAEVGVAAPPNIELVVVDVGAAKTELLEAGAADPPKTDPVEEAAVPPNTDPEVEVELVVVAKEVAPPKRELLVEAGLLVKIELDEVVGAEPEFKEKLKLLDVDELPAPEVGPDVTEAAPNAGEESANAVVTVVEKVVEETDGVFPNRDSDDVDSDDDEPPKTDFEGTEPEEGLSSFCILVIAVSLGFDDSSIVGLDSAELGGLVTFGKDPNADPKDDVEPPKIEPEVAADVPPKTDPEELVDADAPKSPSLAAPLKIELVPPVDAIGVVEGVIEANENPDFTVDSLVVDASDPEIKIGKDLSEDGTDDDWEAPNKLDMGLTEMTLVLAAEVASLVTADVTEGVTGVADFDDDLFSSPAAAFPARVSNNEPDDELADREEELAVENVVKAEREFVVEVLSD